MTNFTKSGLHQYIEIALDKGYLNANTGNAYKAAVNKLLGDLGDDDDVQSLDMRDTVLRYNNRFPGQLSGGSLKKYEQRASAAIAQFIAWKSDPMNYKGPSRSPTLSNKVSESHRIIRRTRPVPEAGTAKSVSPDVSQTNPIDHTKTSQVRIFGDLGLTYPFPLRPDFVAQLVIPRDLSTEEAKRLSIFIQALGHDVDPR